MMPPNEEYLLRVSLAMLASVAASTYLEPAAELAAGAPMKILTSLLREVFLAQLSHWSKFHALGLLKLGSEQKLL